MHSEHQTVNIIQNIYLKMGGGFSVEFYLFGRSSDIKVSGGSSYIFVKPSGIAWVHSVYHAVRNPSCTSFVLCDA